MTMLDPDEPVGLSAYVYPLTLRESEGLVRLVRELGFEDHRSTVLTGTGARVTQVRRWVNDVVCCVAERPRVEPSPIRFADVYVYVRRALRACVDPEFQKAFWSARVLGGYAAAAEFLVANAPARRPQRNDRAVREMLEVAWRLHDPEAEQPIVDALSRIPPGCSEKIAGLVVRRGKAGGNEHRYWVSHPYLGREYALPGEPRRLVRLIFEQQVLASTGEERPRRTRGR